MLLIFRRFPTRARYFLQQWHLTPSPPHFPPCPLRCSAWDRWQNNWTKLWIYQWSFWCVSLPDMCIATAISLLMILICAMATYGAYKVIHYIWWRHESSELHNSVETKLRKLPSNNFLFSCLAENWEGKKKVKEAAELIAQISDIPGPHAAGRKTAQLCWLSAVSNMSKLWANSEFRELNLVPTKIKGIFSHSPPKSVVFPNINLIT